MKKIVLASSSPRRSELLRLANIDFIVDFATIDEIVNPDLSHQDALTDLAIQKGQPIAKKYPNDVVISADTMVCLDDQLLGKAKDSQEAFEMLKRMSNKQQTIYSAVAIFHDDNVYRFVDHTNVNFKELIDDEIYNYLETNEWVGKAGAYAIQGDAGKFVTSIDGDKDTVIGLPTKLVINYLKENKLI